MVNIAVLGLGLMGVTQIARFRRMAEPPKAGREGFSTARLQAAHCLICCETEEESIRTGQPVALG
jgi:hypothetical protein